ncbi:uncharacterized protein [Rutidosis leptorrhynchoides]|uniref:uncharacterized protein n=1 Tax=Rutidosis leptorrhynchoides TaxID=125765 RepID=UPI003A99B6E8
MSTNEKFHPAITVNNIKNIIPITLDIDTSQYLTWAELFQIHYRAYQVIDHILPKTPDSSSASSATSDTQAAKPESWDRLDAIVLQWIYGTISTNFLTTVMKQNTNAAGAWEHITQIFQDNKNVRYVHLHHKFTNIKLENFTTVSAYCQELKTLADQLENVSPAIEEDRLVLQLISGLSESYKTMGSHLAYTKSIPYFYDARSTQSIYYQGRGRSSYRGNNCGQGNNFSNRGRGRTNFGNFGYFTGPNSNTWAYPSWANQYNTWNPAPCPYPTRPWIRPNSNPNARILGPRPQQQQAYAQSVTSTPMDIESSMYTMSLNPPDNNLYMDNGAASHIMGSQGFSGGDPNHAV